MPENSTLFRSKIVTNKTFQTASQEDDNITLLYRDFEDRQSIAQT
jgi:hypothetical protein